LLYWLLLIELVLVGLGVYFFYIAPKLDAYNRGLKFLKEGNIDEALLELTKAVEDDPDNYDAHYKLAQIYLKKNVLIKAEEHFKKVLEIGRYNEEIDKFEVLHELGKIQFELNKLEEAYFTFKEILQVFPHDFIANYYIGLIYAGQLVYESAIQYFVNAANNRPNDLKTHINLGLCYAQIDDLSSAISEFETALKLAPKNEEIRFYLGIALFMGKAYKNVPEHLMEVIKHIDDNEKKYMCYRLTIFSYFFTEKYKEAEELLNIAIDFTKSNSLIDEYKQLLFDYAMIAIIEGEYDIAREKLKLLEVIDQYNTDVNHLLEYVEWILNPENNQEEEQEEEELDIDITPAAAAYIRATRGEEELEDEKKKKEKELEDIFNHIKELWLDSVLPENYLWLVGGLTNPKKFNIEILEGKDKLDNIQDEANKITSTSLLKEFMKLDRKKFIEISRKIVRKLGYNIVSENLRPDLADFVEGDGIDILAKEIGGAGVLTLIQIRRWDQGRVGEIPLRNLTQKMSEVKAKRGVFICPAQFTEGAQKFIETNSTITVYSYNELPNLLKGILG